MLVLGYAVSSAFFAILVWRTWFDAMNAFAKNEMMMGNVYVLIWPAKFVLPIGFAGICLISLRHAVHAAIDPAFSPEPADPAEGHI